MWEISNKNGGTGAVKERCNNKVLYRYKTTNAEAMKTTKMHTDLEIDANLLILRAIKAFRGYWNFVNRTLRERSKFLTLGQTLRLRIIFS